MLFDKKNLNKENNAIIELINRRRRQILIHSYLYYKQGENLISDYTFDMWCKELVTLHLKYPQESEKCVFSQAYSNWKGFSGYDLFITDSSAKFWARQKAYYLLDCINSLQNG